MAHHSDPLRDDLESIIYDLQPEESLIPFMLEYICLSKLEKKIYDDFVKLMLADKGAPF